MQKTAFKQRRHQNKLETIEGKTFFLLYCHSLALYEVASTWSNLILQNLLQITGPYCPVRASSNNGVHYVHDYTCTQPPLNDSVGTLKLKT
jgi:hypothetical protein